MSRLQLEDLQKRVEKLEFYLKVNTVLTVLYVVLKFAGAVP